MAYWVISFQKWKWGKKETHTCWIHQGRAVHYQPERSGQLWDALPAFWLSNRRAHRLSTWSPAGLQNAADAGTLGPRAHALELEQVHSSPHTVVSLRGRSALWCCTEGFWLHVWLIPYLCGFCPSLLGMNFFFVACWQWMLGINFNYPLLWHMYVNYIFPWTLC